MTKILYIVSEESLRSGEIIDSLQTTGIDVVKSTAATKELDSIIQQKQPDALIFSNWWKMKNIVTPRFPLALDLAASHVPENNNAEDFNRELEDKLSALKKADFLFCSEQDERHYYLPFLTMAGYEITPDALPVIPSPIRDKKEMAPLIEFCRNPHFRIGKIGMNIAFEEKGRKIKDLEQKIEQTENEIDSLKKQWWYRIYRKLKPPAT